MAVALLAPPMVPPLAFPPPATLPKIPRSRQASPAAFSGGGERRRLRRQVLRKRGIGVGGRAGVNRRLRPQRSRTKHMGDMETPTEAVHQVVVVAPEKKIATRRAPRSPNSASWTEEAVETLSVEAVVMPETRRGEERVGRAVAEERNAPGKYLPAGVSEGGVLLLSHAPVMTPTVSAAAVVAATVAVAASAIGQEVGRLQNGKSRGTTSPTCSDLTTAWRPRRTKIPRGGVTRG